MFLFALVAAASAVASQGVLTSWASGSGLGGATVTTNAPVLRWNSVIVPNNPGLGDTAIVALRVNVTESDAANTPQWSTGEVRTNVLQTWMGLVVYEGPSLVAGAGYTWTAEERIVAFSNGTSPASQAFTVAGRGSFTTAKDLTSAREEAAAVMSAPNMSALWNGSWHSVNDRIQPSGFLPTSVSGGYGGITQMFVRDASGQIIGLVQCGAAQAKVAGRALRFMLTQLQDYYAPDSYLSYAPHVMQGNKALDKIVSFEKTDQTDGTFYLIAAYGRYCEATGDAAMRADFYGLLKKYALHYLAPGARSLGEGGTPGNPQKGGGVLYWNETLSLLWNPNLEHSRLGSYWSCYDQLTNSFAAEAMRVLAVAATRLGKPEDATLWGGWRAKILRGIGTALTHADPLNTPEGRSIYGELRGHENGFSEDEGEVGYSPLLFGMSYENYVPVVLGLSAIGGNGTTSAPYPPATPAQLQALGLDEAKLDRTWDTYRRLASFQWVTTDVENSAWVSLTHVNSTGLTDPPAPYGTPPPPPTPCDAKDWKVGKEALAIGTGPDIKKLTSVASAAQCCAACTNYVRPNEGRAPGCGVWFFNGETGTCYLKSHAGPDTITKPSPLFAAGYGSYAADSWCTFTGSYTSAPMVGCPAIRGKSCACPSTAVIGKGIGWELGWAAHKRAYTRLISLHRWLGQASHVEQTTLFGESYVYTCILDGERDGFKTPISAKNPRGMGCWGDPGNGVQIGWFLWGEALARRVVGLPVVV